MLVLTLITGPKIRINPFYIVTYARYEYQTSCNGYRNDNFSTIQTADGKRWTVQELPEEIDVLVKEWEEKL